MLWKREGSASKSAAHKADSAAENWSVESSRAKLHASMQQNEKLIPKKGEEWEHLSRYHDRAPAFLDAALYVRHKVDEALKLLREELHLIPDNRSEHDRLRHQEEALLERRKEAESCIRDIYYLIQGLDNHIRAYNLGVEDIGTLVREFISAFTSLQERVHQIMPPPLFQKFKKAKPNYGDVVDPIRIKTEDEVELPGSLRKSA